MIQDNQTVTRNIRTILGPSTEVVRDTDDIINVDTTLGAVNLTLQNIRGGGLMLNPRCIFINDIGLNVAINPITVFASGGDIVNNGASVVISVNGSNAKCTIANQTEWAIAGTGVSAAGISGFGSPNYVPKFIGATVLGNSQVFDNGVSVSIGTNTPSAKALLDLFSLDKGILVPRMTTAQRNAIVAPDTSLLIFNTTTNVFEYYNGVSWVGFGNGWDLNGNIVGSVKYIGTNDNFDFPIRTNGVEVGRFTTDLRLFLGATATNNGSNNGVQYSSLVANRAGLRTNQYGANNSQATLTSFKSRGLVIGAPLAAGDGVLVGDILQGLTAIGVTGSGLLIPLAYTQRVTVVDVTAGNVACDWEISLCPIGGITNSIRKVFAVTSEAQVRVYGDILPQTTATYNLGGLANRFKDIYLGSKVDYSSDLSFVNGVATNVIFKTNGQVGIGVLAPDASSILQIDSTTKGVLLPRMTSAQRTAIAAPATSLTLFNATDSVYEYYSNGAWQIIANRNELQTYSPQQNYAMFQDFDKGVIPQGWTQSTSVGTVVYTQAYEKGSIGQVLLSAGGPGATRASIGFATTFNYILDLIDAPLTKWNFRIRRPAADNGFCQVGLSNSITVAPTAFGSSIVLRSDQLNQSGQNPGLIANWFVLVKTTGVGYTTYDTGIAPTGLWQYVEFEYDNSSTIARVKVKIDGVVVVSIPSSDANLFTFSAPGANLALFPCVYCGTVVGLAAGNTLRIDNFNLLKKWN